MERIHLSIQNAVVGTISVTTSFSSTSVLTSSCHCPYYGIFVMDRIHTGIILSPFDLLIDRRASRSSSSSSNLI
jgi:hypothetical protein